LSETKSITGINPATGAGMRIDIDQGLISAVRKETRPEEGFVCPGLIDLQINGYGGLDLNAADIEPDLVHALCNKLLYLGVTTFLPTLITASEADIAGALKAIADARRKYPMVAKMVPGVHVEGPSISPVDGPRGAHPLAHIRVPSTGEFARWQEAASGLVSLVTLAPEHVGANAYIKALAAQKIHVSLGHTNASAEQISSAVNAGASLSTHLGNGAAAKLPRHPNFIWTQLANERLTAMFIADGHHLPPDTFKAMVRAKGLDKSILVSDSVALAGMQAGVYETAIGGKAELFPDGRISLLGTPFLAGAGTPLCANIATAMAMANLHLADILPLATENPGRFVGGRGRLAVGQRADVVRFGWLEGAKKLAIRNVWLAGVPKVQI